MSRNPLWSLCAATVFLSVGVSANAVMINEFAPNPPGTDPSPASVELLGTPGASFSGSLVFLESDPGSSNPGDVNNFASVSGTFDSNGILVAMIPDYENPAFTIVLAESFTGDTSTDVDADDDGVPEDTSTFGTIRDAIGVPDDSTNDNLLYGEDLGGTNLTFNGVFEPLLVFREAGTGELFNTVTVNFGQPDQFIGVFDNTGTLIPGAFSMDDPSADVTAATFGAVNPSNVIPEPGSVVLLLLGSAAGAAIRMRRTLG